MAEPSRLVQSLDLLASTVMLLPELFLDWFFPRRCVVCHLEGSWACPDCLEFAADGVKEAERFEIESGLACCALLPFELKLVRELLHHLKYNGIYEAADSFLELLKLAHDKEMLMAMIGPGALLLPVPSSQQRLRQRGYNQAALLAEAVGKWLEIPVDGSLISRKSGRTQVGRSAVERAESLIGSFVWREGGECQGRIVLFDDLCTTGSTLQACAQVVRLNTQSKLSVLSLARKH